MDIPVLRDPEGAELEHLIAACQLTGKEVVEIGCGNGRLTWQYAKLPQRVIGIDPNLSGFHKASSTSAEPPQHVSFIQAIGESLPFPTRVFDVVLFSSSF